MQHPARERGGQIGKRTPRRIVRTTTRLGLLQRRHRIKLERVNFFPGPRIRHRHNLICHQTLEMQALRSRAATKRPLPRREGQLEIRKKRVRVVGHGKAKRHSIVGLGHDRQRIARRIALVGPMIGINTGRLVGHARLLSNVTHQGRDSTCLPIGYTYTIGPERRRQVGKNVKWFEVAAHIGHPSA